MSLRQRVAGFGPPPTMKSGVRTTTPLSALPRLSLSRPVTSICMLQPARNPPGRVLFGKAQGTPRTPPASADPAATSEPASSARIAAIGRRAGPLEGPRTGAGAQRKC
ncbi:unnamed protein product [Prorocentrum cordatum]|uniref:Uncharacterized protein n=1 Tax=Prorocentrum cordatum TaxID=2364126 RepID=A0ABN9TC90_9DINO|nr:unnamed protein product [Polarella glacialis]